MSLPANAPPRVPTITVGLRPHPFSPDAATPGSGPVGRVLATMYAPAEGGAVFEFRLEDCRVDALKIPAAQPPGPADGLWRHTCFEAFLGIPGEDGYREFNFSPSGQWAAYAFRAWRERIADFRAGAEPQLRCARRDDGLTLTAHVPPALLPAVPAGTELPVGLAAVIERANGQHEYWAVRHVAAQPDFHARETFALRLTTAHRDAG